MSKDTKNGDPKAALGAKKVSLSLLPGPALVEVARVLEFGAFTKNYGPYNWRDGDGVEIVTYLNAIFRHLITLIDGEDLASDSLLEHLAHIAGGAMIVLDAKLNGKLIDNRHTKGCTGELIEKYYNEAQEAEKALEKVTKQAEGADNSILCTKCDDLLSFCFCESDKILSRRQDYRTYYSSLLNEYLCWGCNTINPSFDYKCCLTCSDCKLPPAECSCE